jgi:peroxiredoxin
MWRVIFCFSMMLLVCREEVRAQPVVVNTFSLRNTDGRQIALTDYPDAKGFILVFTCNHCPFARLYPKRLNALSDKFTAQHVPLLAINSMDSVLYAEEGFEMMQQKAMKEHFKFPYLQDAGQEIGKAFGADHTPEAFVIWKDEGTWVVKYKGAIDDNGEHAEKAVPYVARAVEELLNNRPVSTPETQSFGCRIFYRDNRK